MSPEIRMYFPLTPTQVGQLHAEGHIAAGLVGFAVDDSIRESEPDGDAELWEFLTLQRAASHALKADGPCVVAAADVAVSSRSSSAGQEVGATLNHPLAIADVVCLHLGDDALGDHSVGDKPRGQTPEPVPNEHIDLSWFDISEMAQVVRHLSSPQ